MIFSWFDSKAAKDFGESLARFFMERVSAKDKTSEKKFAKRTAEVLAKMSLQVDRFKQENTLNVYKKAQLGNAFKWTLRDAGYDADYIEKLTEWLTLKL